MLLTLLIEHVIAKPTRLWASSVHSKHFSEWVWPPWPSLVCVPLGHHPKELVEHKLLWWNPTGRRAISHGPPASISSTLGEESIPESEILTIDVVAVAYSVSGITLSGPISVCPGLPRIKVRVFPPGDEERFMDKVKPPPPPGLGPGNMFLRAENDLSTNQERGFNTYLPAKSSKPPSSPALML